MLDSMGWYCGQQIFENWGSCKNNLSFLEKVTNPISDTYWNMWANNGDNISKIYAGTGATTSSVTRRGQNNSLMSYLDHGVKTISRFYLNNFEDDFKQKIFQLLVGQKKSFQTLSQGEMIYPSFSMNLITIFDDKSKTKTRIPLDQFLKLVQ